MENNEQKRTSKELLDHFLTYHHFQWWGEPAQMTTYATLKNDIHNKIVKIIDTAIKEVESGDAAQFSYREPKHKNEWEWGKR